MKLNQHQPSWWVISVTHKGGQRALTLWRNINAGGGQSRHVKAPRAVELEGGERLQVQFASEELCAFQPVVQLASPAKRRAAFRPKLQLLKV